MTLRRRTIAIVCLVCLVGLVTAFGYRARRRPKQSRAVEMRTTIAATPLEVISNPPGDPPPYVIDVKVPKELYADLGPAYKCLDNVGVALMPTRKGFVDLPAGAFGIRASVKGPLVNREENYHIDYRITKNQLLEENQGVCEGDFDVTTKSGHVRFYFSATIVFRPRGPDAPDSFEAVSARITWKRPVHQSDN